MELEKRGMVTGYWMVFGMELGLGQENRLVLMMEFGIGMGQKMS